MDLLDARQEIENLLSMISAASKISDLQFVITSLKEILGLANVTYHILNAPAQNKSNPLLLLTYDPEWVRRYTQSDYFQIDPIVKMGRKAFLPLDWECVDKTDIRIESFFREADRFDVGRHGMTIPIRGPNGERALFTITSNTSEHNWKRTRLNYMRECQLISHFFHDRAAILTGLRSISCQLNLSGRERQCLAAIAEGKPPKMIATDLRLSTGAVQLYLRNAKHKLGCLGLTEAAVKAHCLDLI